MVCLSRCEAASSVIGDAFSSVGDFRAEIGIDAWLEDAVTSSVVEVFAVVLISEVLDADGHGDVPADLPEGSYVPRCEAGGGTLIEARCEAVLVVDHAAAQLDGPGKNIGTRVVANSEASLERRD